MRTAVRETAVALLFVALAAAMTWPLVVNLSSAISDPGDPFGLTWVMQWDYHAVTHHLPLFDANIAYPAKKALAFSEHLFGLALLFFPLFAAGLAPLTIHNFAMLLGFAASGWAMYLLARFVTGSIGAAIIAGVVYAFVGYRFIHLPHVMYVWSPWLPLLLLALLAYARRPTVARATLFGAAFLMNGLSCLHWFVFGAVAIGVTAVLVLRHHRRVREWLRLVVATAIAMLLLLPFLTPYVEVQKAYGMRRSYADVLPNSAQWSDWWRVNAAVRLTSALGATPGYGERGLFPGFLASALAIVALFRFRRDRTLWPGLVWLVIGALGARGVRGAFGTFLFDYVPGFGGIREPVRWVMVAYVGIALLAAIEVAALLRGRPRAMQVAIATTIAAAMLFEYRVAPISWYLMPAEPRPLYSWLRDAPIRGAILELPMTQEAAYEYLWHATVYHRPLINAVSSYLPADYVRLSNMLDAPVIPNDVLDALEQRDCSVIVVHEGGMRVRGVETRDFLRRAIASGRLTFVRRFPAGTRADWVFALTRVEPKATRMRAAEVPDRAGRTPLQNAEMFLNDRGWTYNDAIFGMLGMKVPGVVRGKLSLNGWAVAPSGVARVSFRFNNGLVVVPSELVSRDDIAAALPWYPRQNNGFLHDFAAPPPGVNGKTDLQIEVADTAGHVQRFRPYWFRWLSALCEVPRWREDRLRALLTRMNVADPTACARIVEGSAAIHDFEIPLAGDELNETSYAFARRIDEVLMGPAATREIEDRVLRAVDSGKSRQRAIESVFTSAEFAREYLVAGRIVVD